MRIDKLDGLRGIFSLMIVIYHYDILISPSFVYHNFFVRQSYYFVDFFFVLSGYVISLKYDSYIIDGHSFFSYLKKRFIRLYPLLFFTTMIYFAFELLSNHYFSQYLNSVKTNHELLILTLDTLCFTNSTPIWGTGHGMNYPSWSISSEMISYVFFGLVSEFAIGKKKSFWMLMSILLAIAFSYWHKEDLSANSFGFVRGLICFNLGYFVYALSTYEWTVNKNIELLIPFILALLFFQQNTAHTIEVEFDQVAFFVMPLFFALTISLLLKTNGPISQFLQTVPLKFLGKISYSIYLTHALIIIIIPKAVFKIVHILPNEGNKFLVLLISTAVVILFSSFTQKWIEKGGANLLNKVFKFQNKS